MLEACRSRISYGQIKMDKQEIDDLSSFVVTRKDVEGNEKVF